MPQQTTLLGFLGKRKEAPSAVDTSPCRTPESQRVNGVIGAEAEEALFASDELQQWVERVESTVEKRRRTPLSVCTALASRRSEYVSPTVDDAAEALVLSDETKRADPAARLDFQEVSPLPLQLTPATATQDHGLPTASPDALSATGATEADCWRSASPSTGSSTSAAPDAEPALAVSRSSGSRPSLPADGLSSSARTASVTRGTDEWSRQNPWTVQVRDAQQRRPGDPDYDPTTLYIPPSAEKAMTPFQRQFWAIKSRYYDVVLLFKKGKFYECYDRDADIGHRLLNLNYTGGGRVDMRCVGVPESAFNRHAAKLVDSGCCVGRVEQVETVLAARSNANKVCDRQLTRILTKGTLVSDDGDGGVLGDARYLAAIVEGHDYGLAKAAPTVDIGVCVVDVATAAVWLGVLRGDDERRSKLESFLMRVRPREVLCHTAAARTRALVRQCAAPDALVHERRLDALFEDAQHLEAIRSVSADALALRAVRGVADYLRRLRILDEVFPLRNFCSIHDPSITDSYESMEIDAAAMENLELLRNSFDGSDKGSLFAFLDRCSTAMGRRLLRRWLCHPFRQVRRIEDRLDALEDLRDWGAPANGCRRPSVPTASDFLGRLRRLPDLERLLARLHATAVDVSGAVMFDDTNRRKVHEFVATVKACAAAIEWVADLRQAVGSAPSACRSHRLAWLLSDAALPLGRAQSAIATFRDDSLFEWATGESEGVLRPASGANGALQKALTEKRRMEQGLEEHLQQVRQALGGDVPVRYYHRMRETYQIEVPATVQQVPDTFLLMSQTKHCRRYWTPEIRASLKRLADVEERIAKAEQDAGREVLLRFDAHYSTWLAVCRVVAELDALLSLVQVSFYNAEPMEMCRPVYDAPSDDEGSAVVVPRLELRTLRHPCLAMRMGVAHFVPNDLMLDGRRHPVLVLTGPNMSGKSALLRAVCIAVIMAQMGCYVPASAARFGAPADRLFTRIGARDRITRAQSTFMVEMSETAALLQHATRRSLVILDELGRGTSTFDGYAIAYAVLRHLLHRVGCLTLFATHYHMLTSEPALTGGDGGCSVALGHMTALASERDHDLTFLYRLAPGIAPRSCGLHCARMAGVAPHVLQRAGYHADAFERSVCQSGEGENEDDGEGRQ
ncbi:hypothetical protein CDCA_CDCA01G0171 [Cyanidium caldarium]|uniref:DNA mismatch repair protein n=1 Tax=Cyanidium caldarium TaxID=2771 RepID=A0AAV9IPX4_CYACA|nr:hypothetical protein CDCA_CDCA01G0171 [Cyanidium caldarium]